MISPAQAAELWGPPGPSPYSVPEEGLGLAMELIAAGSSLIGPLLGTAMTELPDPKDAAKARILMLQQQTDKARTLGEALVWGVGLTLGVYALRIAFGGKGRE